MLDMLSRSGSGQPQVLLLEGFSGSGRAYCLESAAYQATERGSPTGVLEVDLGGFEPGMRLDDYLRVRSMTEEESGP